LDPDPSEGKKKEKKKKEKNSKEKKVSALLEKYADDKKFQEFLRVHKRNSFEEWNLDSILNVGKEFESQNAETGRDEPDDDGGDDDDGAEEKVALKETVSDLDYLKSMMVAAGPQQADSRCTIF
jgi:hypothetical protein